MRYIPLYDGCWDEEKFGHLRETTGYSSKNLNKFFWDKTRNELNRIISHRKKYCETAYPRVVFQIWNSKTLRYSTPNLDIEEIEELEENA